MWENMAHVHSGSLNLFWVDHLARHSTVDHKLLTCDEARLRVIGQEGDQVGYVVWSPNAPSRVESVVLCTQLVRP
jgi:hypothetical protein